MTVNSCHRCAVNREIAAFTAYEAARTTTDTDAAVEHIRERLAARCTKCRKVDFDDITLQHKAVEVNSETPADHVEPVASAIPEDAQDSFRRLFFAAVDLNSIDVLLVLYVARGGGFASFGRFLADFADEVKKYGPAMSRATANARWRSLCRRFAPFAALRGVMEWRQP